ncbi:MAG: cytochrome [Pseudonocardiales bacterium]|nr:cytochrome [Pseudonocardiales bacterium]
MTDLRDIVRIEDPRFYLDDPFPVFARMRAEEPVFYYEPLDTFVLTKHEDIRYVNRTPEVFSNAHGIFLNDVKYQPVDGDTPTVTDSFFPADGEQIGTTDPPRHHELRRVISPAFSARALELMDAEIRQYSQELVDAITPGQTTDWMELAGILPIRIGSLLIGLPDADRAQVRHWSDELEKLGGDLTMEELQAAAKEFSTLRDYIMANFATKRHDPGHDLLSTLLAAELDDRKVSEANVVMFAMTMIAAGSDTTRALLAGMVWALAKHPDQLAKLVADRSLIPSAIEEALRWVTPARAFLRTAMEDTEIRGQKIRSGQHVYLMYMAGNRDEDIFPNPETFDVSRAENELQMAFGIGTHVCIGARLVRQEAGILLNTLLDRYPRFELAAEPVPVIHIIRNSWENMPVLFHS